MALLPGLANPEERAPRATRALSGFLLGLAVLTKPVALFPAGAICLALSVLLPARNTMRALADLGLVALGGLLPGVLTLGYFAMASRWGAFADAVISYNSWYASDLLSNLRRGLTPPRASLLSGEGSPARPREPCGSHPETWREAG